MRRIVEGLKNDEDVRPRETLAEWAHSVQFGGITPGQGQLVWTHASQWRACHDRR